MGEHTFYIFWTMLPEEATWRYIRGNGVALSAPFYLPQEFYFLINEAKQQNKNSLY